MTHLFKTLDEIEAAAKEATPGERHFNYPGHSDWLMCGDDLIALIGSECSGANKKLIALANPTTILQLTQALRTAVEALDKINHPGVVGEMVIADMGMRHFMTFSAQRALDEINALYAEGGEEE